MTEAKSKNYKFKAEVSQLLDILTHSLYQHRDVFIRELISNSADALDKVRFKDVQGEKMSDPDLDLEIKITLDKEARLFTISDTGIGMSPDDQAELFTKFFRSSHPDVQATSGTGLGLCIVKSLVELQGGRLHVNSALGEGSTFTFTLPTF